MNCLNSINSCIWGLGLTFLLIATGIVCTARLRLYKLKNIKKIFSLSLGSLFTKQGSEKLKTLSTALGATMGTGNIIGVCSAIAIGGSGAIFWMWVSGIVGMATAFAENFLAAKYQKDNAFGAAAYLKYGVKSENLAKAFALFAIFASLGMGSMAQSNTLSNALFEGFLVPKVFSGAICALFVLFIICGGALRLKKACCAIVVPLSFTFMLCCIAVILIFSENIPHVFCDIFKGAFEFKAALGGFASSALGIGLRRGIFSNEAGLGSSPLFHSADSTHSATQLGAFAAFEVFVDTIVCCTLTALCVLCAQKGLDISFAFSAIFGRFAKYIVAIMLCLFALATVLGWSLCAEKSAIFLFGEKYVFAIRIVFSLAVFFGAVCKIDFVWVLSDIFNGLMAYPNLFAIFALCKKIKPIDKSDI